MLFRTFLLPCPTRREVLDNISNLTTQIKLSLKLGSVRKCVFSVCFRRDVFNYLFKDKGECVSRKCGKMYDRRDFNLDFFNVDNFVYYNKFNEGCCVDFPIFLYSYVKFVRLTCNSPVCNDFCETLSVTLVKKRC